MRHNVLAGLAATALFAAAACTGRTGDDNTSSSSSSAGGPSSSSSGNASSVMGASSGGSSSRTNSSVMAGSSSVVVASSLMGGSSGVVLSSSLGGSSGVVLSSSLGGSSGVVLSSSLGGSSGVVLSSSLGGSSGVVGSSSGGSSSSSGSGGVGPVLDAVRQVLVAGCAVEDRCAAEVGRTAVDQAACVVDANGLAQSYQANYGTYFDAVYTANAAQLQTCLSFLSSAACNQAFGPARPCGFLQLVNPVAVGQACNQSLEDPLVCADNATCTGDSGCQVCTATLPDGAPCTSPNGGDSLCSGGQCINGLCASALPTLGQTCFGACYGNFQCVGPAGNRTCQPRNGLGAPCRGNANAGECLAPLRCSDTTNTCVQPVADGAPCSRSNPYVCGTFSACHYTAPDAAMGTCAAATSAPRPGDPCVDMWTCALDTVPYVTGGGDSCVCRAPLADGEDCSAGTYLCANRCINWVCGTPLAEGAECSTDNACASNHCNLTPGSGLATCQAPQCLYAPPACTTPPGNTTTATATTLTLGSASTVTFCGNDASEYYLRLVGPFAVGTAVELVVSAVGPADGLVHVEMFRDDHGFEETLSYCGEYGVSRCDAFISGDPAPQIYLRVRGNNATVIAHDLLVLAQTVADGAGSCAVQPTNISQMTAVPVLDGATTNATFCGRGLDVEYWWRMDGTYAAGDTVELSVTFAGMTGDPLNFQVGIWDEISGYLDTPTHCFFYQSQSAPRCVLEVAGPATAIYLVTNNNPSLRRNDPFSFTLAEIPRPLPDCANPPANRSQANAVVTTLAAATSGRFCSSVLGENYWWRINSPVTTTSSCRLQVTFANGTAAEDVDFVLTQPNGFGGLSAFASCNAGSGEAEDCEGTPSWDSSEIYVVSTTNPIGFDTREESFTFTVTCN